MYTRANLRLADKVAALTGDFALAQRIVNGDAQAIKEGERICGHETSK
jgi:hypothetical protein